MLESAELFARHNKINYNKRKIQDFELYDSVNKVSETICTVTKHKQVGTENLELYVQLFSDQIRKACGSIILS
jgi:hypothetical protein